MVGSIYNKDAWVPVHPRRRNCQEHRSPESYLTVIGQFEVATNPRYTPRGNTTYCNIFLWDVTIALGCEIPFWWYRTEQDANRMVDWLSRNGKHYGWEKVEETVAADRAGRGLPSVAVWKNPNAPHGPGHVALVIPTPEGKKGTYIAQAGKTNFECKPLASGFGAHKPTFYSHE